ncbi:water stress/hypersensitive response domain-containing protein [Burkholderia sp. ABCPW 14]|uniref:LEA type 2 family protein n=1 Tax=Burkholderia sp. ABCPW 14 TaxID=1637860 RepID=UPI000770C2C4|nr:water stress/hypersensitive response domain-containing protein [Burkholderia sp. ABCPW 14]
MHAMHRSRFFVGQLLVALAVLLALGGCAALTARDPVRVSVVGIEPLIGQGLEMRFDVKLRLQNPNDTPIDYDGVALDLELNGRPFASGVSDARGTVPRFGEQVLSVPVTVSAFSAARQALGLADVTESGKLPYVLRGRLAGGMFGSVRFTDSGTLRLPASPGGLDGGY